MKVLGVVVAMLVVALAAGSIELNAQRVDLKAAASAILKADRDFNQSVADRDLARFLSFVTEGATFNGGTPGEIHGRDAVGKEWAPFFLANGPRVAWKPIKAEVIGGGDLGYSVGSYERRAASAGGQTTVMRGNYLTVWGKQADGAWRVVFDSGSAQR